MYRFLTLNEARSEPNMLFICLLPSILFHNSWKFPLLFSSTCQLSRTKRKVIQLGLQRSAVLSLVPTHVCTQWQISAHTFHILSCSMQFPYLYVYNTIYIGHVWWHGKNHATLPFLVRQSVTVLIFCSKLLLSHPFFALSLLSE